MRYDDQTDMGGTREAFLTTQWSLIDGIRAGQDKGRALIGHLLGRYWKPVYCYLRRKGHDNEQAKDLTQAFFREVVLNRRGGASFDAFPGDIHARAGPRRSAYRRGAEPVGTSRRILGETSDTMLECMYKYGGALLMRGRFAEAESVLCKALKLPQKANNPSMGYLAALLGRQYSRQGRYQEAEELLSEILGPFREAWGEHYGSTFHCVAALAENYAHQGLIDEAEALLLDAVRRSERTDEPRPEVAFQTLPYLGFFYLWQKRYDDAERCAGEALRASLDSYGREHPITLLCMTARGMAYREHGIFTTICILPTRGYTVTGQ